MTMLTFKDKSYQLDEEGFLLEFEHWDRDFPTAMAPRVKISNGLTAEHWEVINYIRDTFAQEGRCPLIYETCRAVGLNLKLFEELFPAGYLRGACKLAGITYTEGFMGRPADAAASPGVDAAQLDRVYQVNAVGFLVNPYDWDRQFAELKAFELKMPAHLTDEHWQVIYYLRDFYKKNYSVPTIYQTCEANKLELEDLERLFPDGYHRGAVKIAGLRVR